MKFSSTLIQSPKLNPICRFLKYKINFFNSCSLFPPVISSFTIFLGSIFKPASTFPIRRELVLREVLLAGPISSGWRCYKPLHSKEVSLLHVSVRCRAIMRIFQRIKVVYIMQIYFITHKKFPGQAG